MREEFIPYELALELKELGFNEKCCAIYHFGIESFQLWNYKSPITNKLLTESYLTAPLWQQAFDFFKEEFGLFFWVFKYESQYSYAGNKKVEPKEFNTYEEARLACLEKLIELAK